MNRWTVHVSDFGKIEKADIQIAPLTLFVGDNNSGKSYLMTLIYGLLNVRFYFEKYRFDTESKAYQDCCGVLECMLDVEAGETKKIELEKEEILKFQALINEVLDINKEKFLESLFNEKIEIGELWLEFSENETVTFEITHRTDFEEQEESIIIRGQNERKKRVPGYSMGLEKLRAGEKNEVFFLSYIMQFMLRWGADGKERGGKRVYLPIARTGFLLTYKTLIGNAMQEKFTLDETEKNLLTRPASDFLQDLSRMSVQRPIEKFQDLIDFIEKHLISGHIAVSDLPSHDIRYLPKGTKDAIPMHVSSGVVTEITPLLLFLKYIEMDVFMIEEPEISLHPKLQWEMARVLVRLTNYGIPVFVTTHSDIILQHINNMIKLSARKNPDTLMEDLGYESKDLISKENVAVYQFDVQENEMTRVERLSCGDYGFEAGTFYDILKQLSEEIRWIEGDE